MPFKLKLKKSRQYNVTSKSGDYVISVYHLLGKLFLFFFNYLSFVEYKRVLFMIYSKILDDKNQVTQHTCRALNFLQILQWSLSLFKK